jgi:Secretion system C-terminal sorting domain
MNKHKQTILIATAMLQLVSAASFAQKNDDEKNIRIKIQINDDGKNVNIDTTFTDEATMQKWMKENDFDAPVPPPPSTPPDPPQPPDAPKNKQHEEMRIKVYSDKEVENLKEEIADLEKNLKEELKSLNDIKIDVDVFKDEEGREIVIKKFGGEKDSFFYSFKIPDCEQLKKEMQELGDEMKSFTFSFDSDDKSDKKIKRSSKVIIIEDGKKKNQKKEKESKGDKKETPAKEEKQQPTKGQTAFELTPENFNLSPNPGKGLYNLNFDLASTEPVAVKMLDFAGREVFSDVAENFTGHYENQIDITGKSRGTYLLQIKQGESWMHKKVMLQ